MKLRIKTTILLFTLLLLAAPYLAYAGIQCAACGAMNPASPSDHRPGCPYGAQASSSSRSSGGHVSHGPSMKTMVATTVMGSLLESVFFSPAAPAGPTPEQIAAQRQLEEQQRQMAAEAEKQRILLQVQKQHEFMRSKATVINKLKSTGPTYVEDKNITTTNGIKLKTIPPSAPASNEAHSGFFGINGAVKPTVALLREPMADGMLTNVDRDWVKEPQQLIEQRIEAPNKWSHSIYTSLKTKAPPLPWKKFSELQPGDVLLIKASGGSKLINKGDNRLSGNQASNASHTVLYLRTVDGVKHFMENVPFQGPRILLESELPAEYFSRGADVAKLAQPLNEKEAKLLYGAAVEMAAQNRRDIIGSRWLGTNYGAWGENDVVCSEADWALLKLAGRDIPKSNDLIKRGLGIDFSPADFYKNEQYFLVSPLDMSQ